MIERDEGVVRNADLVEKGLNRRVGRLGPIHGDYQQFHRLRVMNVAASDILALFLRSQNSGQQLGVPLRCLCLVIGIIVCFLRQVQDCSGDTAELRSLVQSKYVVKLLEC